MIFQHIVFLENKLREYGIISKIKANTSSKEYSDTIVSFLVV